MTTFQQIVKRLASFWESHGCLIQPGYDVEKGAGTFNPATFLRALGPEPYKAAYIEPCRRPTDGRYGTNPNRVQHYFQYQVMLKPAPENILDLYLHSLEAIGFSLNEHDIRFVHDDWEAPSQGAWGLGWEVWMDGMEVTQFTYFQAVGGLEAERITGEITYGLERLAMYLQKVDSFFDLQWNEQVTYGDLYFRNEVEWSQYNFEESSIDLWQTLFQRAEQEAKQLILKKLPIPAYDFVVKAAHAFNLLDARGAISVTERTGIIARIRDLSKQVAELYLSSRKEQGYPLMERFPDSKPHFPVLPPLSPVLLASDKNQTEDFLLEIGLEELPASFVPIGMEGLGRTFRRFFEEHCISFRDLKLYATPRRLTLFVEQVHLWSSPKSSEKKGPPLSQCFRSDGVLLPAGEGFFRGLHIEPITLSEIQSGKHPLVSIRSIKDVPYLFGRTTPVAEATARLLQEALPRLILSLEFPKKMRWGDEEVSFARPIRWLVALLGREVLPFQIGRVTSGSETFGHRQLSPGALHIPHPREYLPLLRNAQVLADPEERRALVLQQLYHLEQEEGVEIIEKERVLPQVLHLVEKPFIAIAPFDSQFLAIPQEVLVSEMVEHQKYFPVNRGDTLSPQFVITANVPVTRAIQEGNQRVLSARLADGSFLYREGVKVPLLSLHKKLQNIVFQKELGSLWDKVERLKRGGLFLQKMLSIGHVSLIERAAALAKTDLASGMVFEFPELQGTIGKQYALAQGENTEVASAIEEHWWPKGEKGALPSTETGLLLSLADKLDNLVGYFAAGMKPTSSSDPYGLRRQVLGIARMLLARKIFLPLQETLKFFQEGLPPHVQSRLDVQEVFTFLIARLRTIFQEEGFSKEETEAVLSRGCEDVYDAYCRLFALRTFRRHHPVAFSALLEVFKRAKGQLEEKVSDTITPNLLHEPSEKNLYLLLQESAPRFQALVKEGSYQEAYLLMAAFQAPLDALFSEVKILAENPSLRANRLALLYRVFALFEQLLDFRKMQVQA